MASITELVNKIRNAIFGKDVRESIAGAIEQCYEDASKNGNANMEVSEARGSFETLNERLNNTDNIKADKVELQTEINKRENADSGLQAQINGLVSGSPLVASSVEEMTDTTRIYVNTTDGHWYTYNGTTWIDGGVYQSTELGDETVTVEKLSTDLVNVGEATGTEIQLLDALDSNIKNLIMNLGNEEIIKVISFGSRNIIKNIKAGTSETKNGLTFESNSDGSVHIFGTCNALTQFYMQVNGNEILKKGDYIISGGMENAEIGAKIIINENKTWMSTSEDKEVTFSLDEKGILDQYYILIEEGTTIDATIYPMFEFGSISHNFEPYKANFINYNGINGNELKIYKDYTLIVNNDNLEMQIEYIKDHVKEVKELGFELENIKKTSITVNKEIDIPIVTLIDDDGSTNFTRLKTILDKNNLKCSLAVITSKIGDENNLSLTELQDLKENGYEILSHSHTHTEQLYKENNEVTDEQILEDLEQSYSYLQNNNMETKTLVYPYGGFTNKKRYIMLAKQAGFKYAVNASGGINLEEVLDNMYLKRTFIIDSNGIDYYKTRIDSCIENNGWLIFGTHAKDTQNLSDTFFEDVINYVIEKKVEFLNFEEANQIKRNICNIGYYDEEDSLFIGRNGIIKR